MDGLFFDFETNDIVLKANGSFATANIGSQSCALVANSQVCRLTKPEVGEQLSAKIVNRKGVGISRDITKAEAAVKKDGGKNVSININDEGQVNFYAEYDS
jgi:hypothetical protein